MRVIIVDDEPLVRRGLALRLQRFPDIEIVSECPDGPSAVQKILELSPDLVFLDVQLPGCDGFEVLRALPPESLPSVVFLTAYEQHAVRAFEVHALDYLLKPVDENRLAVAVHRALQFADTQSKQGATERILELLEQDHGKYVSHFAVRSGPRIQIVDAEDVEWVGAAGYYAELHSHGCSHLLRDSLNALEKKLDPAQFVRIHRSRIVRLECIRELRSLGNREYAIKLSDNSEHRSSRTYATRVESWLASDNRTAHTARI